MTHLFDTSGEELLARLAAARTLVAFDFDGTLAPLVPDRDRAQMPPRTHELFAALAALYPCAVISGREMADVAARVNGTGVRHVIGNHGLEPSGDMERFRRASGQAWARLSSELAPRGDVDLEDKGLSFAVHYRRARRRREAKQAIHAAIARLPVAMRVIPGRLVVNLVPEGAPDKGDALRVLKAAERCDDALYVGDDVTDEDVFRLQRTGEVVAVRVGRSSTSEAAWFLRDQSEVDRLLERLVALRLGRRSQAAEG